MPSKLRMEAEGTTRTALADNGLNDPGESTLAAVVHKDPRRIEVEERRLEPPGSREVVVRTEAVGICHTDLDMLDGHLDGWLNIRYPIIFGHEWSGEVVQAGRSVEAFSPGDRVTGCVALGDNEWFGTTANGAAAQRFVVPERLLYKLPPGMSYERGALVEPFACAYRGIRAIGGADPSDAVCIVGAGTIGLCSLMAAKALGAQVLAVEPSAARRAMIAEWIGADAVLDPTDEDDLGASVEERLDGRRPDLVIEAAGAPSALASALELTREDGRLLFLGHCNDPIFPAPLGLIKQRSLRVAGSSGAPSGIWPGALRFLAQSDLDLSPMVKATFPLAQAAKAFEAARDVRTNLKVHIRFGDAS